MRTDSFFTAIWNNLRIALLSIKERLIILLHPCSVFLIVISSVRNNNLGDDYFLCTLDIDINRFLLSFMLRCVILSKYCIVSFMRLYLLTWLKSLNIFKLLKIISWLWSFLFELQKSGSKVRNREMSSCYRVMRLFLLFLAIVNAFIISCIYLIVITTFIFH